MSSRPDSIVGRIFITDYLGRTIAKTTAPKTENTDGDIISRIADPSDDLQSGGLTEEQLGQTTYPGSFSDPLQPFVAELRRLAIYNNYRALTDTLSSCVLASATYSLPSTRPLREGPNRKP